MCLHVSVCHMSQVHSVEAVIEEGDGDVKGEGERGSYMQTAVSIDGGARVSMWYTHTHTDTDRAACSSFEVARSHSSAPPGEECTHEVCA